MKKDIIIYGTHGLGREVAMLLEMLTEWNIAGFLDDTIPVGSPIGHSMLPTLDFNEVISNSTATINVVIAVADPRGREKLYRNLSSYPHVLLPTIIAPSAIIAPDATIGEGSIIGHYVTIGPNTKFGKCTLLNTKSAVGHDTETGDFCTFLSSTNISGNVSIGNRCFFGDQSFVIEKRKIGNDVRVGAGSRVFTNIEDKWSVFGYPATRI